jgi:hypothetical protein
VVKNKLHTFRGDLTKYNSFLIIGYDTGMKMSEEQLEEIIVTRELSMPTLGIFERNAKAQLSGFVLARKNKMKSESL